MLGKRANKMKTHGVLTIRFEMPFNVRCGACEHMIAKGVRFNADKKKVVLTEDQHGGTATVIGGCYHIDRKVKMPDENCFGDVYRLNIARSEC